jgi:hypothetical protein
VVQIRQWIREHRVDRHTRLFVHDPADWTPACLVPELAADFPAADATPGRITPPAPAVDCSLAKAGLICGILSVTVGCCCGGVPFNLLGLVLSVIALVQVSQNPQRHGGRALALAGLILSILSFLTVTVALALR